MHPYGVKGENGICVAGDFVTACLLEAGKYTGKTFRASTWISGRKIEAMIGAESYDVAYRLFQALLKAERIHGVTQITITPA